MPSFSLKRAGHVTALPVLPETEFLVILSASMYLKGLSYEIDFENVDEN
jgi:hypothetical protein